MFFEIIPRMLCWLWIIAKGWLTHWEKSPEKISCSPTSSEIAKKINGLNKYQEGFSLDINWVADVGETLEEITQGYFEIIQALKNAMGWISSQYMSAGAGSKSLNPW